MLSLKELVAGGKKAHFKQYRQGNLYYETDDGFVFQIPITDCGDTPFQAEDSAISFMKWIRKALAEIAKED